MSETIYINGKFAAQRVTGVQRFARELTGALDELLPGETSAPRFVLLLPPGTPPLGLTTIAERTVRGPASLHLWEQVTLPWAARRGVLLNLTGSAPLLHPRQVASLHDMAVFDHPEAYTRGFATWYRFLFKVIAARAVSILTVSNFSKRAIERILRPSVPVTVVYNAAAHITKISAERPVGPAASLRAQNYVLAVGSTNPTKNFGRLLECLRLVPNVDTTACIVGGSNAAVFDDRLRGETGSAVIWAGAVSDRNLKWLYENARLFVFPSYYEGFGIPPLEAMACGCPVIASDAAAIPEVCGDAAVYFNPYDVEAMAAALRWVAGDDALRNRLISAGRQRAEIFSWARSARCLLDAVTACSRPQRLPMKPAVSAPS